MTQKAVVNALEAHLGMTGAPCQITDAIERILLQNGFSAASAAEKTHQIRQKIVLEIVRRRETREGMGELAVLHLKGQNNEIICGSSFVLETDSEAIRQSKLNRLTAGTIYSHIRGLSFQQFETFGRSVLRELGCQTAKVTAHAGDQGIDFYGELSVGGILGADPAILKLVHETRFVLVGQAKHYPQNAVGPATVRELVGALSLSRTYTFSSDDIDLLDDVHLRPFSPVMALLFSTGEFTKGARHLAKKAGLIAFSGWQLAVLLADKGVGIVNGEPKPTFDPATFNEWLA